MKNIVSILFCCIMFLHLNAQRKTIQFSGEKWIVKTSDTLIGPGPNYFSDSEENVWVDKKGRLHLKITNDGTNWNCAEIMSIGFVKYGEFSVYIKDKMDAFDPNLIFSTFMYGYINDEHQPELDIEYSYWGDSLYKNNTSYSIHNYSELVYNKDFEMTPHYRNRYTYFINWKPNDIEFRVNKGHNSKKCFLRTIDNSIYSSSPRFDKTKIPQEDDRLRFHINFWLLDGKEPMDEKEYEIIITEFRFQP